jgi:hypothetical protein
MRGKRFVSRAPLVRDYATHFDAEPVGFTRSPAETGRTMEELMREILHHRTHWPVAPPPAPAEVLPLPPVCAVAEALDDIARGAADPSIYMEARVQLAAGVPVAFDGRTRWVDGVVVELAPPGARWPWPWRCACGMTQCWHGALCDALLLAADRETEDDLAMSPHRTSYTMLLLVSSVSLLILWQVHFPVPEQNPLQTLGNAASLLTAGHSCGDGGNPR